MVGCQRGVEASESQVLEWRDAGRGVTTTLVSYKKLRLWGRGEGRGMSKVT